MISKEALELAINTAQAAAGPTKLCDDPSKQAVHYLVGDKQITVPLGPAPRDHRVYSLDDLIAFVRDHSGSDWITSTWHSRIGVVAVLDDDQRRDYCTLPLTCSVPFEQLRWLDEDVRWLDQRAFVRLLHFALGIDRTFVAPFRRLDWSQQTTGVGEVVHGRDRLGSEISAAVTGAAELPEDLMVRVPVYRESGETDCSIVRCAIMTDPSRRLLNLRPLPGEVDAAIDQHQQSIHERLLAGFTNEESEICTLVYYGRP